MLEPSPPSLRAAPTMPSGRSSARILAVAIVLLFGLSVLFRIPALLNARSTNSDAAIVGLQATHLLRGELSPFLWGSGYQTSVDAFVAAGFFAIFGATPLTLMASALALHILATWLAFDILRRRFEPLLALVLCLPLVFSPSSIHTYALYPPRQASLTLAIAALWAVDRSVFQERVAARGWLALGGVFFGLAVSADPYPLVLAPVVIGYAALTCARDRLRSLGAFAAALAVGLVPFVILHRMDRGKSGPLGLSPSLLAHNWDLLVRECLPWAMSYKVYYAHNVMDYVPWQAPAVVHVVQVIGAFAVLGIVVVGLGGVRSKRISLETRRLGFVGSAAYPITIGAFLVSVMVMDIFSMRYLAVLTSMLPFASATAARLLGRTRFALLLAPHLVASALGGWVGYGPFVDGAMPVLETPELRDDDALFDLLRSRGITYAEADYWTSYRLTFRAGERIVVVPSNPAEDRYPPYRRAFEAAETFAYVFDPGRSREDLEKAASDLSRDNASVERTHAGGLTVLLVARHAAATP